MKASEMGSLMDAFSSAYPDIQALFQEASSCLLQLAAMVQVDASPARLSVLAGQLDGLQAMAQCAAFRASILEMIKKVRLEETT